MILTAILISTAAELLEAHKKWQDVGEIILSPDTSLTESVPDDELAKNKGQEDDLLQENSNKGIESNDCTPPADDTIEGKDLMKIN